MLSSLLYHLFAIQCAAMYVISRGSLSKKGPLRSILARSRSIPERIFVNETAVVGKFVMTKCILQRQC